MAYKNALLYPWPTKMHSYTHGLQKCIVIPMAYKNALLYPWPTKMHCLYPWPTKMHCYTPWATKMHCDTHGHVIPMTFLVELP